MDTVKVTKLEAASRQLELAIEMMFYEADPIAVHTLAGAGAGIASTLVEHHAPDKSWDKAAQKANGLTEQAYFRIMHATQNFLKHAKTDPDPEGVHEFAISDTEAMIFWALMNLGEVFAGRKRLTATQSVYQYWFIASQADVMQSSESYANATKLFGDMSKMSRADRLAAGRRALERYRNHH